MVPKLTIFGRFCILISLTDVASSQKVGLCSSSINYVEPGEALGGRRVTCI